jgi:two-component system chemotaxis response regulator CheY
MLQAENGEEGIACARAKAPDVILLDYNMPVMDGYHTLVELKTDPSTKSIPVVMLTTETVMNTVVKLMKLGLNDYIAKPFTREVLLEKLNPILGLADINVSSGEMPLTGNCSAVPGEDCKPTILAIDDKRSVLDLLNEYLGDRFNILAIESGRTALAAVIEKRFDYVFLDLSMPDVDTFEILRTYLKDKKNAANARRVVAMTLRTSNSAIEQAIKAGVSVVLYKPFTKGDVTEAVETVISRQKEKSAGGIRYLCEKGKVRILKCPSDKDSNFRLVSSALSSGVISEIDEMAEEGLSQLVISVGEGFLTDIGITRKFVNLMDHVRRLSLNVRLVADSEQARESLKMFAETASIPTESSL